MPVSIGPASESTFANPIGLLSECHRRIERFLHALVIVTAEARGGSLDARHRSALEVALKYFRHAAPMHTADEEEDLFPALRDIRKPCTEQLLARVDRLENEHRIAVVWHRAGDELGERWLHQDHLSGSETARLAETLQSLSSLYETHIAIEEKEVFPVAQDELTDFGKQIIGRRMALRRGIPFIPESARAKDAEPHDLPCGQNL